MNNYEQTQSIIIAITGASGAIYGIRALEILRDLGIETHLVVSRSAVTTINHETGKTLADLHRLASYHYQPDEIGATIASGSFPTRGMIVVPCSIKTLSSIANSYSDNLIARAADVTLKEGKPLILAVRETPLHRGHLQLMDLAAQSGAVIFPPVPALYGENLTLDDIITGTVGRMLLRMGISNPKFIHWNGLNK
jgi:4-hydroxy-3-polyprenylbenzoate decarboxylase